MTTRLVEHYTKHRTRHINSIARALKGDKAGAEDVVREASIRALKYAASFNEEKGDYSTWFNAILRASLSDYIKSKDGINKEDVVLNDLPEIDLEPVRLHMDNYNELLKTKKKKHAVALNLFFMQGYNAEEVSELTGMNKKTIHNICSLFRKQLANE